MTFAHARDLSFAGDSNRSPRAVPISPAQISLVSHVPAGYPAAPDVYGAETADGTDPAGAAWPPGDGPASARSFRRIALCPGPESARGAREFTTQTLRGWQLDAIIEEAVIIASELVTNAIRHGLAPAGEGGSGFRHVELSWQRQDSQVICTVTDSSAKPPVLAPSDVTAETGRGLQIVQGIAEAWGWMLLSATSKAVWAALQSASGSLWQAREGARAGLG